MESETIKRPHENEEEENNTFKKQKVFSAKEFRRHLGTEESTTSLLNFLELCKSPQAEKYIIQYLNVGGNLLEILQQLDDNTVTHSLVLDVAKCVLLHISATEQNRKNSPFEACRYMLNTHITLVNKMVSAVSNTKDRIIILKLLTAMVTLSPALAKDILLHVLFNQPAIDILISSGGLKSDNPRNAFVQFLTSFLLDGSYPIISLLLSKKNLLSSVINGLQYDQAETVCMVIQSLKQFILENPAVSKTVKMKTFSTPVVKDLVNLYNWKGPGAKWKKSKSQTPEIDLVAKSKVTQCVHDFLLVLCTSHKYGVIFRDDQVGLQDRRHQNALMYTVLESLDRPWEHSYAAELVLMIAKACPDLVRTVWSNMREFLDPRPTAKWLKTINYANNLVEQMDPICLNHSIKNLSIQQYSHLIQILVSPTQILHTVIPKRFIFECTDVKLQVIEFLITTLTSINSYLNYSKKEHSTSDYVKVKLFVIEHIKSNYPNGQDVLRNWTTITKPVEKNIAEPSVILLTLLTGMIQLLTLYSETCPELLNDFTEYCKISELFENIPKSNPEYTDHDDKQSGIKVSIIKLFYFHDPQLFMPEAEMFEITFSFLMEYYHKTHDIDCEIILRKLFANSNIFDGCDVEIDIWMKSIFAVKKFSKSISDFFIAALRLTTENGIEYYNQLSKCLPHAVKASICNTKDIIEVLQSDNTSMRSRNYSENIRHNQLAPYILGCVDALKNTNKISNKVKECFNYALINLLHAQTQIDSLVCLIKAFGSDSVVHESVTDYVQSWSSADSAHILNYGTKRTAYLQSISSGIISGDISNFFKDMSLHKYPFLDSMLSFYISNLGNLNLLSKSNLAQLMALYEYLKSDDKKKILQHPNLLSLFKPQSVNDNVTIFIVNVARAISEDNYLHPYSEKVQQAVLTNLATGAKESSLKVLTDLLSVFKLDNFIYKPILDKIAMLNVSKFIDSSNNLSSVYYLTVYCLSRDKNYFSVDKDNGGMKRTPLDCNTFNELTTALQVLNSKKECLNTSALAAGILQYLTEFPHHILNVDDKLFESILLKTEYCKENAELAVFILKFNSSLDKTVADHVQSISNKKGVMLPIIDVIISQHTDSVILETIFHAFEISIAKAFTKPQKAGVHFQTYYTSVGILIEKFSSETFAKTYYEKTIKYDQPEGFLAHLLKCLYEKHLLMQPEGKDVFINNSLLTMSNIMLSFLKNKENMEKTLDFQLIAQSLFGYLQRVKELKISFAQTSESDSFRLFCKFALKIGISGQHMLLKVLKEFLGFIELADEDAELFVDMIISHSEFLTIAQGPDCSLKRELFGLLHQISERWIVTRKGDHIPILLCSFAASNSESDITILRMLKLYESVPAQTNFYDYKPFIIGDSASNFYSIRPGMRKSLWRQPNMADVLQFLDEPNVIQTLKHLPNCIDFHSSTFADNLPEGIRKNTYNLQFLLPLFTSILAPENNVPTYMFSRCGALSLTIVALSSDSKEVRHSACFVLSRYYHHLEANHKGKDHLVWLRFVQSLCRGLATLEYIKLTNIVAIALAQMALILTQPTHIMYTPLASYLTAKDALDVATIPELYTFVNSSSLDAKEHRSYILGLIQSGLKTKDDIKLAAKSMLFKLIMDMYHSSVNNVKLEILKVILAAVKIPLGSRILCETSSIIPWLYGILQNENIDNEIPLRTVIVQIVEYITNFSGSLLLFNHLVDTKLKTECGETLLKCAIKYYDSDMVEFDKRRIEKLLTMNRAAYMIKHNFDSNVIEEGTEEVDRLSLVLTSIYLKRKQIQCCNEIDMEII